MTKKLGPFELNTIIHGDCIEVMAQLPDACVDAIITDPPYGLEFMGKEWDGLKGWRTVENMGERTGDFGGYSKRKTPRFDTQATNELMQAYQQWTTAWATEAYRILKPGAYMLVMGGTRTHHRLGCGLEDAGFEIRDELAWIYASGFPKNYDVSKGIDKRAGAERTEVIGQRHRNVKPFDNGAGWNVNYTTGDHTYKAPATPEAQYWEGYGTALKPAHEPIWLCKKPNEGTYVDNVLKHGCGAMNIDATRTPLIGIEEHKTGGTSHLGDRVFGEYDNVEKLIGDGPMRYAKKGRWPANVLVDCYPEEFIGGVVIEGEAKPTSGKAKGFHNVRRDDGYGFHAKESTYTPEHPETHIGNGLLSPYTRFFVIPKPGKKEKNKGCAELYYRREKGQHIRIDREEWEELIAEEKCIKKETGKQKALQARGNIHVTVKPVRLGKWLIKLITPHQHPVVVLDPFCGSGTFLVSAKELNEGEGYQISFLGIDKDEHSIETAEARLKPGGTREQPLLL